MRRRRGRKKAVPACAALFGQLFLSRKATIYVVVVLIVSAYLSYMVITVGNDVFAFVKGDREVTVTIPEGATRKQVAYLLESNGLIEHEWAFNLFSLYRWDDDTSFIPGEHTLNIKYELLADAFGADGYPLLAARRCA